MPTDRFYTSATADTRLHCQTTDTELVHRTVCTFTFRLSLVLIHLPTEGWPGWAHPVTERLENQTLHRKLKKTLDTARSTLVTTRHVENDSTQCDWRTTWRHATQLRRVKTARCNYNGV